MSVGYLHKVVRASAVLTTSYVAATAFEVDLTSYPHSGAKNQIDIDCIATKGSLDSVEVKVEFSHDNVTFVPETFSSIAAGTDTLTISEHKHTFVDTAENWSFSVPLRRKYVKISAKGTGTAAGSLLEIDANLINSF